MWLLLVLVVAVSAKSVKCSPDSDDKQCGANESYVQCAVGCPNNYCPKDENTDSIVCDPPRNCPPGCVCKVGYRWKSEEDKTCIPAEECPPVECTRPNEDWHPCPSACVTDSCEDFKCQPDTCNTFVKNCQPKCACATGYCRNNEGVCVTAPSCQNRPNEVYVKCRTICPPQSCNISYTDYFCETPQPCEPGWDCIENYLRNDDGVCILNDDCPGPKPVTPSPEETTCEPTNTKKKSKTSSSSQSESQSSSSSKTKSSKTAPSSGSCTTTPVPTDNTQCGANQTYADCSFACPNNYCPDDDNTYACKPPRDCPPGCMCKIGYRFRSSEDKTCILAEECPPVECTRPNEVWYPCPSECVSEYCEDFSCTPVTCNTLLKNCQPKCACASGYCRNNEGVCVMVPVC